MSKLVRAHIQQNIVGYIALFCFVMGGTAYATHGAPDTISSEDIIDGEVKSADIGTRQVKSGDVANDTSSAALVGEDIAADTLTAADIADTSSLGTAEIDESSLYNDSSLDGADIDETSLDATVLQQRVTGTCTGGQAIREVAQNGTVTCESTAGGGPPTGPAGGDLLGSTYPDPEIAAGVVGSGDVNDNSLTGTDIAESTLFNDNSLTAIDIQDTSTLGSVEINESDLFNDDSIDAFDLAPGSVGTSEVAADSLAAGDLAASSVGSSEVATDSLVNSDLATSSVGPSEVADNTLTDADIANTSTLGAFEIDEADLSGVDADELDGNDSVDFRNPSDFNYTSSACNPTSSTPINCVGVSITLPSISDVLVTASGAWNGTGVGAESGGCGLRRDSSTGFTGFSDFVSLGQDGNEHEFYGDGFARTGIDENVTAGTHTWHLDCFEATADFTVDDIQITATRLSG